METAPVSFHPANRKSTPISSWKPIRINSKEMSVVQRTNRKWWPTVLESKLWRANDIGRDNVENDDLQIDISRFCALLRTPNRMLKVCGRPYILPTKSLTFKSILFLTFLNISHGCVHDIHFKFFSINIRLFKLFNTSEWLYVYWFFEVIIFIITRFVLANLFLFFVNFCFFFKS